MFLRQRYAQSGIFNAFVDGAKRAKAFLRVIARDINRAGLGLQGLRYRAGNLNKGGCVAGHNAV